MKKNLRRQRMRRWHRRLGLLSCLFVFSLSFSGLLINLTDAFRLDQVRISWPWLMNWYGLEHSLPESGYIVGDHWMVQGDDSTILDGKLIFPQIKQVVGMAVTDQMVVIASHDELHLLTLDGEKIETLALDLLPVHYIKAIGGCDTKFVVKEDESFASSDGASWQKSTDACVTWSKEEPLTKAQMEMATQASPPSLPLTRLLADAHSGRILGRYGPAMLDGIALVLMILAATGVWLSSQRKTKHSRNIG